MSEKELVDAAVVFQTYGKKGDALVKSHLEKTFSITLTDEKVKQIKKEAACILSEQSGEVETKQPESRDETEAPPTKKPKPDSDDKSSDKTHDLGSVIKKGEEEYFVVSKAKSGETRFGRSKYRGKWTVQLRHYYESNGDLLPGKQGIAIKKEEWDVLMKNKDLIEKWFQ
jgi:gas vesicle protein